LRQGPHRWHETESEGGAKFYFPQQRQNIFTGEGKLVKGLFKGSKSNLLRGGRSSINGGEKTGKNIYAQKRGPIRNSRGARRTLRLAGE